MSKRVTIIGGGVIGLCCAYYLQKSGNEVCVIEREEITDGTSFGNAGYISPSHFIPLASPGILSQGLRWMLSSSSPFYIKPRLDVDLLRWGLTFWKCARASKMAENIPPLSALLRLSRTLMSSMKEELGNTFRMVEGGCLMLYKTDATEKHEFQLAQQATVLGMETRRLSAQEVQAMEPELEVSVRGGVLYPLDCHLHPGDFMRTLKTHLGCAGVKIELHTVVTGFEKAGRIIRSVLTDKGSVPCEELVIANGSWMPQVTRRLGFQVLMQAGKGYSITYENVQKNLHYPAILVDDRVAMTPMGKDLRMGGTMEISGINKNILIKRVEAIFNASRKYYPDLELEFPPVDRIWNGLRPLTPDGLPYIGPVSQYDNCTLAGGHAMLGLSLAAATGKLVEEMINQQKTSIDCSAFRPGRF